MAGKSWERQFLPRTKELYPSVPPLPMRERAITLAATFGLDVDRFHGILDRIAKKDWGKALPNWLDDDSVEFVDGEFFIGLALALESLPVDHVLSVFETPDLRQRLSRMVATQWLVRICPERLHTLPELARLTGEFLAFLKRNKGVLLATGYPARGERFPGLLLDRFLAHLYPPALYLRRSALRPLVRFASPEAIDDNDTDTLNDMLFARLKTGRGHIFDLKVAVLEHLHLAARNGDVSHLREQCLRSLTTIVPAADIAFYLQIDRFYKDPGRGIGWVIGSKDAYPDASGGVTALLNIVGYYEAEIGSRRFERARSLLADLIAPDALGRPQLGVASYAQVVDRPEQTRLDAAIDLLLAPAAAMGVPFHEWLATALDPMARTVVEFSGEVQARYARQYMDYVRPLANWVRAHQEATGQIPPMHDPTGVVEPPSGALANTFRREGGYWTLRYRRETVHLRDSKGLRYIAHLLRQPDHEIHALAFVAAVGGTTGAAPDPNHKEMTGDELASYGLTLGSIGGAGRVTSDEDREEHRRRRNEITEYREELDAAEANGDLERASELRETLEWLTADLTAAFDIKGRERDPADPTEKARKAISVAIGRSLTIIKREHPDLHRHLHNAIKTGTHFSYSPDVPTDWDL